MSMTGMLPQVRREMSHPHGRDFDVSTTALDRLVRGGLAVAVLMLEEFGVSAFAEMAPHDNLTRVMNIMGIKPLMAAIRA